MLGNQETDIEKMNIVEMRMLRWMRKATKNGIKTDRVHKKLGT